MKSCTPVASRPRAPGHTSPKRIQNSPYVQAGGKSSPKKVKLGWHHPLMPTPLSKAKAVSLLFQPPHLPFSSTPKGPGRKEPSGAPWPGGAGAERGFRKAEPSPKLLAGDPAVTSERSHLRKDSVARREGGREDGQRATCPKVEPVQKQLVSRADFSHQGSDHEEDPGRLFADQCVAAWTGASSHPKDREQHLRLYHQQFQQPPPLLQQKLNYQPLEKFLARYKSQEIQVRPEAPCPDSASPRGRDETMQLEELDDSDFSEDSFSPGPGWKKKAAAEREARKQSNQNSFFLHRRDFGAGGRDGEDEEELFWKWCTFEKEGTSEEESGSYEEGGRSLCDWSSGEISAVGSSPHGVVPEKPYCSKDDDKINPQEQKPRSSDPTHGCPDGHFSPPRKRTQSPPLAAILPEPPFSERRGPPKGTDFRGALDFPMELADDSGTPLSVSFLNSGPAESQGKRTGEEEGFGRPSRCWEEDAGPTRESGPAAPASSIYEINRWGIQTELGLSPGPRFQWLPQPCGCPGEASILEVTSAFAECVCGYAGESPLAELLPRHPEEGASLRGNLQTSEDPTVRDSDLEVAKIAVSWSYSAHLGLGGKETPEPLALFSPVDKGGVSSPPDASSSSDDAGNKQLSERSPPSQSDLSHGTEELRRSEEACRKEETQEIDNCEDPEQDSGAEPEGTETAKNSWKACGQVDLAEGGLKEKDALGR